MQNIPDNKLDDFLKEKSENARIAFNPKAWEKMEQKLDVAYSRRTILRRFFLFSFLLLVVSSLSITWMYFSPAKNNSLPPEKMSKVNEQLSKNHIKEFIDVKGIEKNSDDETKSVGEVGAKANGNKRPQQGNLTERLKNELNKENLGKAKVSPINNTFDTRESTTYASEKREDDKKAIINGHEGFVKPEEALDKEDEINASESTVYIENQKLRNKNPAMVFGSDNTFEENLLYTINNRGFMLNRTDLPLKGQLTFNSKEEKIIGEEYLKSAKKDIKPVNPGTTFGEKVRLNFLVSPDVSSALGIQFGKTGYSFGLSLEYFLLNRLSVTASVLRANKLYTSNPDCYEFPSNYSYKPNSIDGSCVVWDIPINVRYFFFSSSKLRTYASAGVSSYIMRKEEYKYEYYAYSSTYKYPKGNNHLFSVINFSIGAEYKLGERFSIGVEPFLKVPTKGVGEGKIKLNTAGAFLSANYKLFKK